MIIDVTRADAATRLESLERVAAGLAAAPDYAAVATVVTEQAATTLGADAVSLCRLVGPATLLLVGIRHAEPERIRERWATFTLDDPNPVSEAVRTRRPVEVSDGDELARRYPGVFGNEPRQSMLALPLLVEDRCLGALALGFAGERHLDADEQLFLRTLVSTCAQAVDRLAVAEAAEARARRLAFLADASAELASSLDYQTTLTNVARLALGELADWVGVELLRDGHLHPVVTMHVDPDKIALARELRRRYPTDPDAPTGVPAVVRTGVSELFEYVPDEVLVAGAVDEGHLKLIRQLDLASVMMVPLTARGRVLGALVLISSTPKRLYDAEDLAFAEDLARRAAVAIDNAQLHSQTLDASLRLQRAVLPSRLPDSPRWRFGVHYHPSGRTEVGGDFFDAVELPDGRLIAMVGDVMGRGVAAAAAMAHVRSALRAYAAVDPDPTSVLDRVGQMFETYGTEGLVTVTVALATPDAEEVRIASAGHLPPVLRGRDGAVSLVDLPQAPPLGAGNHPHPARTLQFARGSSLLLYSDGLVERRDEDIDTGIGRLLRALADLPARMTDADAADLAARLITPGHDDDVTVLAVQAG